MWLITSGYDITWYSSYCMPLRGPDAAAEDGTAVDTTAEDGTAEDATAELFNLGWTLRRSHQILTLPWTLRRNYGGVIAELTCSKKQ